MRDDCAGTRSVSFTLSFLRRVLICARCVATLDTQYQRNFRKVMRSALQQVKGRIPDDLVEQQQWRREVLALYRWTGDGTGLAL